MNSLSKTGDYEAAARFAFYAGQLEKSMQYLRFCKGRYVWIEARLRSSC